MTTASDHGHDDAMLEAASWKIRLTEDPDDKTLQASFEAWRVSDDAHDRAWRKVERAWTVAADLMPQKAVLDSRTTALHSSAANPQRKRRSWPLRSAMGIAASVLVCVIALRGPELVLRLRADYVTSGGETRTVTLPDGSTAILGPRSALALHYAGGTRAVTLLDGEAFFKVVHDSTHGFAVTAGTAVISDIGTAFDVRIVGERVTVAVREGLVGVSRKGNGDSLRMIPGQQWSFDQANGQEQRKEVEPENVGAWTSGHLILDGMTLADAVQTLGRYYPGMVLTHGLERDATSLGGVYDLRHPKEALQAVVALHGGKIVSLPEGVVLVLGGQKRE